MKNVLLLSAGRRVSLLRGFQEAASRRGAEVFAADMRPGLSAACHVATASFSLPHALSDEYPGALLDLCRKLDIGMAIPTIDTELPVLASLRANFEAAGIHLVVALPEIITVCADKRDTATFFAGRGLPTPELYDRNDLRYPVLVKPCDGSLSAGVVLIESEAAMTPAVRDNPRNIFCRYIDHATHDEFTIDLYYDRTGELRCAVPRRRIEVRGGEVAKAIAEKNEIVDLMFAQLGSVPGARGCLTLQLFRHRETQAIWCIEINPRFGGGYPLSRHAGADYQDWLLREYLEGLPVAEYRDWRDQTMMLRYDAEVIVDAASDS